MNRRLPSALLIQQASLSTVDVESVRAEIAYLSRQIECEEPGNQHLRSLRTEYQRLLSPFHRLPNELLSMIMFYAVRQNVFAWTPGLCKSDAQKLSGVCRRWRDVAMMTWSLWSRITMLVFFSNDYPDRAIEQLRNHLTRSRNAPLDLVVEFVEESRDLVQIEGFSSPALDLLLEESHRWRSLQYVQAQFGAVEHDLFLDKVFETAPPVVSLEIQLDGALRDTIPPSVLPISRLPKLRSFRLSKTSLQLASTIPASFQSLTHISLETSAHDAMFALNSLKNVTSAELVLGMNDSSTTENKDRFSSPTLHSLSLQPSKLDSSLTGVSLFLSRTSFPRLSSLSLVNNELLNPSTHVELTNALTDFVLVSGNWRTIRTLRVVDFPLKDVDLFDVLTYMQHLKALEVQQSGRLEDCPLLTLKLLGLLNTWPPGSRDFGRVAPGIQYLSFSAITDRSWYFNVFENMIQSRVRFGLQSVFLRLRDGSERLDLGKLERLNRDDVAVRVVDGGGREIVRYWGKMRVGLRKNCWRDLLTC
ncbi:hypothetical protein V5O48_008783 [Marasmius crinis-equi]|uniref:F-box domain-containing protein n=1 Tax=Marasmius crinis-equi TaxID=585013 RepID=A0ABR3FCX5_9AGAR